VHDEGFRTACAHSDAEALQGVVPVGTGAVLRGRYGINVFCGEFTHGAFSNDVGVGKMQGKG